MSALQNLPRGEASPGHLNSLPITAEVLTAVRKAHAARLRIAQGSGPTAHNILDLVPQPEQELMRIPFCPAFKACGRYLAVLLHGKPQPVHHDTQMWVPCDAASPPSIEHRHDLAMFEVASTSLNRIDFLEGAFRPPVFSWAPDLPHLSVVCFGAAEHGQQAQEGVVADVGVYVAVFNAASGKWLHQLGISKRSMLYGAWCRHNTQLEWSPSGRYLLVTCHADNMAVPHEGRLTIFNVCDDEIVAFCDFEMQRARPLAIAIWYSSSRALILSDGVNLEQPEARAAAGFGTGPLPQNCFFEGRNGPRWSPDGASLVVCVGEDPGQIYDNEAQAIQKSPDFSILGCSLVEDSIHFVTLRNVCGRSVRWLPCSSKLLCSIFRARPEEASSSVLDLSEHLDDVVMQGKDLQTAICTPSVKLLVDGNLGLCAFDIASGQQLWAEPDTAVHRPLAFLPSGCGLVCSGRSAAPRRYRRPNFNLHIFSFA